MISIIKPFQVNGNNLEKEGFYVTADGSVLGTQQPAYWQIIARVPGMKLYTLELQAWEKQQAQNSLTRLYAQKLHRKHPRQEVLQDYRHHRPGGHYYTKECKSVRRMTKRLFRRRMCRELWNEAYYRIRARDYKTYGWLTW